MRNSLAFICLLGSFLLVGMVGSSHGQENAANDKPKPQEPRKVRLVPVTEGKLPRTVTVTGTLAADETVVAAFKVAGRVSAITVDLGDRVRKGQELARLDATDFQLRVNQAEAALHQARSRLGLPPKGRGERVDIEQTAPVREAKAVLDEARLGRDRMARLLENKSISQAEFDAAQSKFLVADGRYQASIEDIRNREAVLAEKKSDLELARQQLADAVLRAPLDGAVRERRASVGEFLAAGAEVLSLVRIHPLRLKVAVPERDAPAVRKGQEVIVEVDGDDTKHRGRIARLSPVIEEQGRTLAVEAEVDNSDGKLRPGSFARAGIVVDADAKVLLVSNAAIVNFAGLEKIITAKDGQAVERRIRTGRKSGDLVEVVEGLKPGDLVVAEPGNLAGGQPVTVTP